MSATGTGTARDAVDNARVLLQCMIEAGWAELRLVCGACEISISRDGSGTKPINAAAPAEKAELHEDELRAPHVATLEALAKTGTMIRAGEALATISVLDKKIALPAPWSCAIVQNNAEPGTLIGYGERILTYTRIANARMPRR